MADKAMEHEKVKSVVDKAKEVGENIVDKVEDAAEKADDFIDKKIFGEEEETPAKTGVAEGGEENLGEEE